MNSRFFAIYIFLFAKAQKRFSIREPEPLNSFLDFSLFIYSENAFPASYKQRKFTTVKCEKF